MSGSRQGWIERGREERDKLFTNSCERHHLLCLCVRKDNRHAQRLTQIQEGLMTCGG